MTDEQRAQRLHHHMYETCEGIAEHAERIVRLEEENAKLRELAKDMFEEIEAGGFDPMVERHGKSTVYYEEDMSWRVGIRERVRELGIEVEQRDWERD